MIAGGSGITPMYQVAQAILRDPHDATNISLIYANVAEEDILLRKEFDVWSQNHRARFKVAVIATPVYMSSCSNGDEVGTASPCRSCCTLDACLCSRDYGMIKSCRSAFVQAEHCKSACLTLWQS